MDGLDIPPPGAERNGAEQDAILTANGYEPIAVNGKRPVAAGWSARPNTIEAIAAERAAYPHATNTGLRTGRLVGVDIDVIPPDHVAAIEQAIVDVLGLTSLRRVGAKGAMLCYRNEMPIGKITVSGKHPEHPAKVEFLGNGQQLVAYGLHPDTGREYEWTDLSDPLDLALDKLPGLTPEALREAAKRAADVLASMGYEDVMIHGGGDNHAPLEAPAGVGLDEPHNVDRARQHLRNLVARGDVPIEGNRNSRTYAVANELIDLGLSTAKAGELIEDEWVAHGDEPDEAVDFIVEQAWKTRENAPGCHALTSGWPAVWEVWAKGQPLTDNEIDEKFMGGIVLDEEADFDDSADTFDYNDMLRSKDDPPPLAQIEPGWVVAGVLNLVTGRGGVHKSRLMQRLMTTIAEDAAWLETVVRDYPHQRQGVPVADVEYLNYENSKDELHRRARVMAKEFPPTPERPVATARVRNLVTARPPLLIVSSRKGTAPIRLTRYGRRRLQEWQDRAQRGHTVLILDGFFDAVQFEDNTENSPAHARAVIALLDRWCKLLDATILALFHPSRAGLERGDTGYSPAFENRARNVLHVAREEASKEPTGRFTITVQKSNDLRIGRIAHFTATEDGALIFSNAAPLTSADIAVYKYILALIGRGGRAKWNDKTAEGTVGPAYIAEDIDPALSAAIVKDSIAKLVDRRWLQKIEGTGGGGKDRVPNHLAQGSAGPMLEQLDSGF